MGWQRTTNKPEQPNNSRTVRDRPQSVAIPGREVERIILQQQYSSTEITTIERNGLESSQQTAIACTVVGQILRVVGDKLENVKRDNYEITHYGRV